MVKVLYLVFLSSLLFADTYTSNCLSCHNENRQFKMFMQKYILNYSSERNTKKAIYNYLKSPLKENSIMPTGFINRWGIKEKSTLSDTELLNAIDRYYEIYNIKQKIK